VTVAETVTIPASASAADSEAPRRSWLRWPLYIAAFVFLVWFGGVAITFLIHHTRLQQKLTHRLESVFGRHVEVGNYDFSLWTGPTLVAESVTFSEDPRFGHEYFLRAESVAVRLHWQSLFRGRMDLGTVTLERPSLNLVRDAAGNWNVAEWLPRITNDSSFAKPTGAASTPVATSAASPQPYVRFDRVLFNDGRINFKRVEEKIPFALTDVTGSVEPDAPGRWHIDLEAIPTRAAVPLQQPGTIHVAAQVGGTSSRFRPANLALTWQEGSVSDLLRLARGYDFGVRGDFALAANAHADADDWQVETTTRFRSIHRWDLSLRPDNPDFNVVAKFMVHPQASGFDIEHATIEAPHSRAEAAAHVSWDLAPFASRAIALATDGSVQPNAPTTIEITQSQIDLRDLLGWIRAFHPEVPPDTTLSGFAAATATLSAGPARLVAANVRSDGAELSGSALRVPAHISPVEFRLDPSTVSLAPVTVSFGSPANSLHIDASSKSNAHDAGGFHVAGSVEQVRDLVTAASSLGWHISRGWDVAGPARADLRWPSMAWPWRSQPTGTIDFGVEAAPPASASSDDAQRDATLLAPFLNEPVRGIKAHVDVKPDYRRITLSSADAFGTRWTGTLERHDAVPGWQFALSADHLVTADVDRWLNPRWRQSLLARVLPFLGGAAPSVTPEDLRAEGRITIDQLTVAPVVTRHVQGDLKLNGRDIDFTNATAQLASGNLAGTLNATLAAVPSYRLKMNFSGVDLGDLSAVAPSLANQFDGAATGEITLESRGASRSDLAAALSCDGTARVTPLQLKNLNLDQTFRQAELRAAPENFHEATAAFTCTDSTIDFSRLTLSNPAERLDATGSVDFSRQLDMTFKSTATPGAEFQLTGPLASPSVKKVAEPRR
jgi:hypothetical protein